MQLSNTVLAVMWFVTVSGCHMQRTRKASASDEQTGDSTRSGKKAKKQEVHPPATPVPCMHSPQCDAGALATHLLHLHQTNLARLHMSRQRM